MDHRYHDLHIKIKNGDLIVMRKLDHSVSEDTRVIEVLNRLNEACYNSTGRTLIESIKID